LDGKLWVVEGELVLGASGNPLVSALNDHNNVARFHPDFEAELKKPGVLDAIVQELLVEHFSETQFEDILEACGLRPSEVVLYKRLKRDPEFRQNVLDAYGHKCAICDYDLKFRTKLIGVEAAHVQWHNSRGPDIVQNGIALCALHHKLFDYGAIGLSDNLELIAAKGLSGNTAQLNYLVYDHEGKQISLPRNGMEEPSPEYVRWQRKEIFKG
jgi:putative restriction endonuclease